MSIIYYKDASGEFKPVPTIQGKSAYQYAVEGGYKGSEEEFKEFISRDLSPLTLTVGNNSIEYNGVRSVSLNIPQYPRCAKLVGITVEEDIDTARIDNLDDYSGEYILQYKCSTSSVPSISINGAQSEKLWTGSWESATFWIYRDSIDKQWKCKYRAANSATRSFIVYNADEALKSIVIHRAFAAGDTITLYSGFNSEKIFIL